LDGRKTWEGTLAGVAEGRVMLETAGRQVELPLAAIAKAHLKFEW